MDSTFTPAPDGFEVHEIPPDDYVKHPVYQVTFTPTPNAVPNIVVGMICVFPWSSGFSATVFAPKADAHYSWQTGLALIWDHLTQWTMLSKQSLRSLPTCGLPGSITPSMFGDSAAILQTVASLIVATAIVVIVLVIAAVIIGHANLPNPT